MSRRDAKIFVSRTDCVLAGAADTHPPQLRDPRTEVGLLIQSAYVSSVGIIGMSYNGGPFCPIRRCWILDARDPGTHTRESAEPRTCTLTQPPIIHRVHGSVGYGLPPQNVVGPLGLERGVSGALRPE